MRLVLRCPECRVEGVVLDSDLECLDSAPAKTTEASE